MACRLETRAWEWGGERTDGGRAPSSDPTPPNFHLQGSVPQPRPLRSHSLRGRDGLSRKTHCSDSEMREREAINILAMGRINHAWPFLFNFSPKCKTERHLLVPTKGISEQQTFNYFNVYCCENCERKRAFSRHTLKGLTKMRLFRYFEGTSCHLSVNHCNPPDAILDFCFCCCRDTPPTPIGPGRLVWAVFLESTLQCLPTLSPN